MKEKQDNHFRTHHVKDIKELLSKAPGSEVSACVIQAEPKESRTEFLDEQGELIKKIWFEVTGSIQNIYGFRISWGEIVFFHMSLELYSFQIEVVNTLKSTQDANLKSKAIFSKLTGTVEDRLKEIDRMGLQLHKINYWKEHIYPSYWENGMEIKL